MNQYHVPDKCGIIWCMPCCRAVGCTIDMRAMNDEMRFWLIGSKMNRANNLEIKMIALQMSAFLLKFNNNNHYSFFLTRIFITIAMQKVIYYIWNKIEDDIDFICLKFISKSIQRVEIMIGMYPFVELPVQVWQQPNRM